uniref:Uncharacterized protein n=1 Tax=Amphimedon queenslandica TaxID=400682 RepID=A0A1X7U9H0_AMPQE
LLLRLVTRSWNPLKLTHELHNVRNPHYKKHMYMYMYL